MALFGAALVAVLLLAGVANSAEQASILLRGTRLRLRGGQHGVSESPSGPFGLDLAWTWHHSQGRFRTLAYGTAIDGAGNIYLTAADAHRKFSPEGRLLWEHSTLPAETPNAAALVDGRIYNADTHGQVFALSAETGEQLWSTKVSKEIAQDNGYVTARDGVVLVPTDGFMAERNQKVRGINATDGTPLWSFSPDVNVWNFRASFPGDGTLLFQDQTGKAYRLRLRDGTLIWKAGGVPGSWTDGTPTLGENGLFYTVHNNLPQATDPRRADQPGTLSARRASDGAELWSVVTPRPPNNAPAVGRVYGRPGLTVVLPVGQQMRQAGPTDVMAYDAATGAVRWIFRGPAQRGVFQAGDKEGLWERLKGHVRPLCLPNPWSAPAIDGSGTVFVGSEEGPFFALRDVDGDGVVSGPEEAASFDTKAAFPGSSLPALAPGRVAVASCDSLFVFGGPRP